MSAPSEAGTHKLDNPAHAKSSQQRGTNYTAKEVTN